MFGGFLESEESYNECRRYWRNIVEDLARSSMQSDEWLEWIPRFYADGKTPIERDISPICDGWSKRLNRAFQVFQSEGDEAGLAAWLKHYEDQYPNLPRDELVLNIVPSSDVIDMVKILLMQWMNPLTTIEEMRGSIEKIEKKAATRDEPL